MAKKTNQNALIDASLFTRTIKFKTPYKLPSGVEIKSCKIVGIYRRNNDPKGELRVLITHMPKVINTLPLKEWNKNAAPLVVGK